MAQSGSVHVWGAWGRKFESCHPDTDGIFFKEKLVKLNVYGLFSFLAHQFISNFFKLFATDSVTSETVLISCTGICDTNDSF